MARNWTLGILARNPETAIYYESIEVRICSEDDPRRKFCEKIMVEPEQGPGNDTTFVVREAWFLPVEDVNMRLQVRLSVYFYKETMICYVGRYGVFHFKDVNFSEGNRNMIPAVKPADFAKVIYWSLRRKFCEKIMVEPEQGPGNDTTFVVREAWFLPVEDVNMRLQVRLSVYFYKETMICYVGRYGVFHFKDVNFSEGNRNMIPAVKPADFAKVIYWSLRFIRQGSKNWNPQPSSPTNPLLYV